MGGNLNQIKMTQGLTLLSLGNLLHLICAAIAPDQIALPIAGVICAIVGLRLLWADIRERRRK